MIDDQICEKSVMCPIYTGVLDANPVLIKTYKHLYCENGAEGRAACKRYQTVLRVGSCPPSILPNSHLSVDDIVKKIQNNG
jgi:hypothetical protein